MFLHNKKKLHHPQFTFSRSSGRQFQISKSEIYKKKGKNVNKCSYIIKKAPPPSIYLFQESWAPIPSLQVRNLQKRRKKNVNKRS